MDGVIFSVEKLKEKKEKGLYTNEAIAARSGVPLGTVQKIFGGATARPRRQTLEKLSAVFTEQEKPGSVSPRPGKDVGMVSETPARYIVGTGIAPNAVHPLPTKKKQGEFTLEDYLALPDEQRVELIDGVFYDMSAPLTRHQAISGEIYSRLLFFVTSRKGTCMPFIAPTDVQLDCDDKTIVQPDVMVVCDRDKLHRERVYGAPDLVVEVLSRSTKRKDMILKLFKYEAAGVREYWLVDPDEKEVIVYTFMGEVRQDRYTFSDKVPVAIFGGECIIDFTEIYERILFLYEKE